MAKVIFKSPYFWLHIKKSAGSSIRKILEPHYPQVDRTSEPPCFVQADSELWNDILNNFRTPLGEYQLKRCLFAKRFLYENWDNILSFAFSRHPEDRCVSMFFYLYEGSDAAGRALSLIKAFRQGSRFLTTPNRFDAFLDLVEAAQKEPSWNDLHFRTHSAAMHPDVTDDSGNILLQRIYRIESLDEGLREILHDANLPCDLEMAHRNRNQGARYRPKRCQRARIEKIYSDDYAIYESALAPTS